MFHESLTVRPSPSSSPRLIELVKLFKLFGCTGVLISSNIYVCVHSHSGDICDYEFVIAARF
jgi:hypothetical protein